MTSFSIAICMNKTKIHCGQLNCSVKLADVLTRCSSHPQGKSEVRCEKGWCSYRRGYCARTPMRLGAEGGAPARLALARLPPPPSFFIVAIQQPGSS